MKGNADDGVRSASAGDHRVSYRSRLHFRPGGLNWAGHQQRQKNGDEAGVRGRHKETSYYDISRAYGKLVIGPLDGKLISAAAPFRCGYGVIDGLH